MDARNTQRREINKYIKQNCKPSWTHLREYTDLLLCDATVLHGCPNLPEFILIFNRKDQKIKQKL